MMKKNKTTEPDKETRLAKATSASPFAWFDEMDRWFDTFRRTFEERFWGSPLARWSDSGLGFREPAVDLIDQGSGFLVRAELPGVSKEDVDLKVTSDGIEIRAEKNASREEKDANYFYQERSYQGFQRVLNFPVEVKPDLAAASLRDGVLEVRIPKKEPTPESKPVKVQIE